MQLQEAGDAMIDELRNQLYQTEREAEEQQRALEGRMTKTMDDQQQEVEAQLQALQASETCACVFGLFSGRRRSWLASTAVDGELQPGGCVKL